MNTVQKYYHSYLLRLWRVKADGDSWRASLQEVQSGEVRGFTNPGELFRYLEELLQQATIDHKPDPEDVADLQDSLHDGRER